MLSLDKAGNITSPNEASPDPVPTRLVVPGDLSPVDLSDHAEISSFKNSPPLQTNTGASQLLYITAPAHEPLVSAPPFPQPIPRSAQTPTLPKEPLSLLAEEGLFDPEVKPSSSMPHPLQTETGEILDPTVHESRLSSSRPTMQPRDTP